jgi:hypothetical protein
VIDLSKYSFCEPAFVATAAPWCIRPLTAAGRKLSGGVDTSSLCGRVDHTKFGGWDIARQIEEHLFDARAERAFAGQVSRVPYVCQRCVAKLRGEP